MAARSDARKSREQAEAHDRDACVCVECLGWRARRVRAYVAERRQERRREITRDALAAVYPHASMDEADCLLDQFETLGARLELS